jgi:hypothetical protein
MADELPVRVARVGHSRQLAQATRAQERTELAIYEHGLESHFLAEIDRLDSQAIADVTREAIEQELANLSYGLELAQGSAAKAELVSRLVNLQSTLDNRRIAQRFGGR